MLKSQTTTWHHKNLLIPTREEFYRNFGGIVYPSDFNTDNRGKNNNNGSMIAARIASDYRQK